jgi:hypothetical protein
MSKKIIRARLKPYTGSAEFVSVAGRIKSLIEKNKEDIFHFVVEENKIKTVKEYGILYKEGETTKVIEPSLCGETVPIINSKWALKFNKNGTIEVVSLTNESLPREETVKQLKRLRKLTKGTDIGDRISDMNKQGANIQYIHNVIDTGIESYEDFEKNNKKFVPSWNLKHVDPFGKKFN